MVFGAILAAIVLFIFVMFAVDIVLHVKAEGEEITLRRGVQCSDCGQRCRTIKYEWILEYHGDGFSFACPHCGNIVKVYERLRWKLGK